MSGFGIYLMNSEVCGSNFSRTFTHRYWLTYECWQVFFDTNPLIWFEGTLDRDVEHHEQEFPHLVHMTNQYLTMTASSVSPERLSSTVLGL